MRRYCQLLLPAALLLVGFAGCNIEAFGLNASCLEKAARGGARVELLEPGSARSIQITDSGNPAYPATVSLSAAAAPGTQPVYAVRLAPADSFSVPASNMTLVGPAVELRLFDIRSCETLDFATDVELILPFDQTHPELDRLLNLAVVRGDDLGIFPQDRIFTEGALSVQVQGSGTYAVVAPPASSGSFLGPAATGHMAWAVHFGEREECADAVSLETFNFVDSAFNILRIESQTFIDLTFELDEAFDVSGSIGLDRVLEPGDTPLVVNSDDVLQWSLLFQCDNGDFRDVFKSAVSGPIQPVDFEMRIDHWTPEPDLPEEGGLSLSLEFGAAHNLFPSRTVSFATEVELRNATWR